MTVVFKVRPVWIACGQSGDGVEVAVTLAGVASRAAGVGLATSIGVRVARPSAGDPASGSLSSPLQATVARTATDTTKPAMIARSIAIRLTHKP
jgi:hypothetical protein